MWRFTEIQAYTDCVADLLACSDVRAMARFPQHTPGFTCFDHCVLVSYTSYRLCRRLGLDARAAARGGLLHDFYLYDWTDPHSHKGLHGFCHPAAALKNARERFPLTEKEADIILKHMFPLTLRPYRFWESFVVSCMDKFCAVAELLRFLPEHLPLPLHSLPVHPESKAS